MQTTDELIERLTLSDLQILAALDDTAGLLTRDVAKHVDRFGSNGFQHSGAVRAFLGALAKRGFVKPLDDQKPVCWVRTESGLAALRARASDGGK